MILGAAVFAVSLLFCAGLTECKSEEKRSFEYCIVGGGPYGLQLAYYLQKAERDYVVFERNNQAGSFFAKFPRHRKLISLNKVNTGTKNPEYNLRHDWNSLLVDDDDESLEFRSYSKENFPHADYLVQYLDDYHLKYKLKVQFNTSIGDIKCIGGSVEAASGKKNCLSFEMKDQHGRDYSCKILVVSTGLSKANIPENLAEIEGYESVSVKPEEYDAKNVLILGRGNAAFELASSIYGRSNLIHMVSRSHLRQAYSTHYVGDVRTLSNQVVDTYQLKSLDGFLDLDLNTVKLSKINGKYYWAHQTTTDSGSPKKEKLVGRIGYDKVIRCLGFKFDFDVFNQSTTRIEGVGRKNSKKYPLIDGTYESAQFANLYFGGTVAHSLDFRKSSGGFIHGFRYAARALFKMMQKRYHDVNWTPKRLSLLSLMDFMLRRINEASGPYQMFGQLVDVFVLDKSNGMFEFYAEFPLSMLDRFEQLTGGSLRQEFLVVNYQYGEEFSGPGKDVFKLDRAVSEPSKAHNSNFLHPVIYYYEHRAFDDMRREFEADLASWMVDRKTELFKKTASKIHHMLEDFLAFWNEPSSHQLHLRRFLESILSTSLKKFSKRQCLLFHASHGTYPPSCAVYFEHQARASSTPSSSLDN